MVEDNVILIGMHRMINQIDRKTAHIAAKYDLTLSQFGVLEALYHVGDLTVGEVKEKILSSDGTIPVVVKNLEKRGLLFRKQDPRDKRKSILSLTEEGRNVIAEAYPENAEMIRDQLSAWTKEEKRQLSLLLRKFMAGANNETADAKQETAGVNNEATGINRETADADGKTADTSRETANLSEEIPYAGGDITDSSGKARCSNGK